MDDKHLLELRNWHQDVEEYVEMFGLECHKERFKALYVIINGERVSVERVKGILSLIERIDSNKKKE